MKIVGLCTGGELRGEVDFFGRSDGVGMASNFELSEGTLNPFWKS